MKKIFLFYHKKMNYSSPLLILHILKLKKIKTKISHHTIYFKNFIL